MNLAPTSSTTAMLVMGDAAGIALIPRAELPAEDYAVFHRAAAWGAAC